jgi:hypothetical protein
MRRLLFSISIALFGFNLMAQTNYAVLNESRSTESILTFSFNQYQMQSVQTPHGTEQVIWADQTSPILEKGSPDLPKYSESLIIPDKALMKYEILDARYTEYTHVSIAPSKGNLLRNVNPDDVAYEYGRTYQQDQFYPGELAAFNPAYIMRDFRGQTLQVFPFQYNPVTKVLRVYSEIKIKVYQSGDGGENVLDRTRTDYKVDREFNEIYQRHFINYQSQTERYTALQEEGSMLIICHKDWLSLLQPLVLWKNTIGRPTELVSSEAVGTTAASIKTFVTNYYNTHDLAYLLLIGDAAQIPTNSGTGLGGHSDNAYAYISGNDHYQEFFVGRFSAETVDQVNTQVLRTIEYEKGDQLATGWLNKIMSVASSEGPGDDNELDYEHLRNIQPDLLGFTYENPVNELFDGSQGAFDAAGNPTPAQVSAALNTGVGVANYVGHGSDTYWVSSGFSVTNVMALQNYNKLPFIFDVACVNGNFVSQTCFGESWMRSHNNGEPTGAIAIIASTINQSWNPPMIGQDEMNDILVESASAGIKRTFGGITVNGYFKMNEESSDFAMTDTWTCFGDPSLLVRTDDPATMTVSHSNVIIVGSTSFPVNVNFEDALATISFNGTIIGSDLVESGVAEIPVSGLVPGQVLTLAVVGFNQVTYIANVTVISPSGSYLIVNSYPNTINYGQTQNMDMTLKNVGADASQNATATVSTTHPDAIFTNPTFNYGTINADAISSASSSVYTLTVADDIIDQTPISYQVQMTDDSDEVWNETKTVLVQAPAFTIGNLTVSDATGNNDGILDPGETADILISVTQTGHADVTHVIGNIVSTNTQWVLNSVTTSPVAMAVGTTQVFSFNVTALTETPDGTPVQLDFSVSGGVNNQYSETEIFEIIIGFVPEYCAASGDLLYDEYISRVQFNTIDNSSERGAGYTDFTNISTDVVMGQSYPITITNGEHFSSDQMGCWVDWNYDGDFNDANETFLITYGNPTGTGSVVVPSDAHLGNTRMRLRVMYTGSVSSCGVSSYGEVEDYTLNVQNSLDIPSLRDEDVSLYPNPNNGSFNIKLNHVDVSIHDTLEIFNLNGQLIYQKEISDTENEILINTHSGVYMVKITLKNGVVFKKVVIE